MLLKITKCKTNANYGIPSSGKLQCVPLSVTVVSKQGKKDAIVTIHELHSHSNHICLGYDEISNTFIVCVQ